MREDKSKKSYKELVIMKRAMGFNPHSIARNSTKQPSLRSTTLRMQLRRTGTITLRSFNEDGCIEGSSPALESHGVFWRSRIK